MIQINQVGYLPKSEKRAILTQQDTAFELVDEAGEVHYRGNCMSYGEDISSGDWVSIADFRDFQIPGRYRVRGEQSGEVSPAFEIGENTYDKVLYDLMRAFYFLRCGCGLESRHAGVYAHGVCHNRKAILWEDHRLEKYVSGGWHDAGDYGRYITAGSCALAHLLYAYRMFPKVFQDLRLNIPESGNRVPDILNECRYELEWFLKMQMEDGGVSHKVTTAHHAPFVMPEKDVAQLYILPVSSMATADFAAVCAMAAPLYREYDGEFADRLREAAHRAYGWLQIHPEFIGFRNPEGCTTGEYGERDDLSNRFWAAAAMFSLTGEESYHADLRASLEKDFPLDALGYGEVGGFGALEYLLSSRDQDERLTRRFLDVFARAAARCVRVSQECGYGVAMREWEYFWGSNMGVMQRGIIFAIADFFGLEQRVLELSETVEVSKPGWHPEIEEPAVRNRVEVLKNLEEYAQAQLDYLLGCNAMGVSYVTGNGENAYNFPHLRPAHADGIDACMPGMVSGGPNGRPCDEAAKQYIPQGTPPMKCFIDHWMSYSVNEITIYWNSPAVFTLAYLLDKQGRRKPKR